MVSDKRLMCKLIAVVLLMLIGSSVAYETDVIVDATPQLDTCKLFCPPPNDTTVDMYDAYGLRPAVVAQKGGAR